MSGLQNASVSAVQSSQATATNSEKRQGIVYSIILDETHPYLKNREDSKNKESIFIGAIEYKLTGQLATDEASLPIAYPLDKNFKTLPVKNEAVEIINGAGGTTYYKRIGPELTPFVNADMNAISKLFNPVKADTNTSKDYSKVQSTGISRSNTNESAKYDNYGDYFKYEKGIHKLKLWEGDTLFESRFGQSIRFSGYNNDEKKYSPVIIIRNGENADSKKLLDNEVTKEDINRDGSIIAITSDKFQLGFVPGKIDDKGKGNFETKPESFENYPDKLIGDQILLNSGRIILSAKSGEMLFYSKKNYGFISDGGLSIDNKGGIDVSTKDNVNFITNDRDFAIHSGKGSIFLGDTELEPLVKGTKLVELLAELIDAIVAQNYLTPSGPSKVGPENLPTFSKIKSKLNNILSKLNQTS
jgi:hypothetical protein